ncbi:hypothetical protein BDV93DRAFT_542855 [Ceratobasidium sp. AG-I]|nr:hypothetical protein BDV93DRAFT_542855 [Ceratobasidium sp. AG-I]
MTIRPFHLLPAFEVKAYELLVVCYSRAYQISEQVRAMEPNRALSMPIFAQAVEDMHQDPGSIANATLLSDGVRRAEQLRRCREIFDSPAQTLYDHYRAFCAVEAAVQTVILYELVGSGRRDYLVRKAHTRAIGVLANSVADAARLFQRNIIFNIRVILTLEEHIVVTFIDNSTPPNPKVDDLGPGDVIFYTLDDESRECRVTDRAADWNRGDYFVIEDGPVGGPFEGREIEELEMEELVRLA